MSVNEPLVFVFLPSPSLLGCCWVYHAHRWQKSCSLDYWVPRPFAAGTPKLSSYIYCTYNSSVLCDLTRNLLVPAAAKRVREWRELSAGGVSQTCDIYMLGLQSCSCLYSPNPVTLTNYFASFMYVTCVLDRHCKPLCGVHSSNYWPPQKVSGDCKSERGFFRRLPEYLASIQQLWPPLPTHTHDSFQVTWTRLVWSVVSNLPEIIISELNAISRFLFYVGWMRSTRVCDNSLSSCKLYSQSFVVSRRTLSSRRWKRSEKVYNLLNLILLEYSRQ